MIMKIILGGLAVIMFLYLIIVIWGIIFGFPTEDFPEPPLTKREIKEFENMDKKELENEI